MDTRRSILTLSKELHTMVNHSQYETVSNSRILALIQGIIELSKHPLHPLERILFSIIKDKKLDDVTKSKKIITILEGMKKITEVKRKENAEAISVFELIQKDTSIEFTQEEMLPGIPTVNAQEDDGSTPLIIAAGNGDLHCMKILIEAGAELDTQDHYGHTALIEASWKGHTQCVDLLLEKTARKNIQNKSGYTALILAATNGHSSCALALVKENDDPEKNKESANKALRELLDQRYVNDRPTTEKMKFMEGVRCLIKIAKADPNSVHKKDYRTTTTPLFIAAENNNVPGMEVLIAENANVHFKNEHGVSALLLAIQRVSLECIRLLMKAGAREENILEKILKPVIYRFEYKTILSIIACLIASGEIIKNKDQLKKFLKLQDQKDKDVIFCYEALNQQKQAKTNVTRTWASYFGTAPVSLPKQKPNQKIIPAGNDAKEQTPLLHNQNEISKSNDDTESSLRNRFGSTG